MSRLGEQGSLPPMLWNVGGFGVAAILYALYAIGIADRFGWRAFALASLLQSVTIAGGAVFSCESGCTPMHQSFGLAYLAITCLIPFIAAWSFRRRDGWRTTMRGSLIVGTLLVALFIGALVLSGDRLGLWQRLVLFPAMGWQAWISIRIDRIEAKWKLSQNRSAADVTGVIVGLEAGSDHDRTLAAAMDVVEARRADRER